MQLNFRDKDEERAFAEVYDAGPDRARAVVMAAILENRVTAVLQAQMLDDHAVLTDLFGQQGPLGNFGAKIRLLHALRIISHGAYDDLYRVNRIRNEFAHNPKCRSFADQPVCDLVERLTVWPRGAHAAVQPRGRERFKLAVSSYIGEMEAIETRLIAEPPRTPVV